MVGLHQRRVMGFTLLEMMVVMALLAMLMSLAGPRFVGQLERSETRFAVDQLRGQFSQLPRWARLAGEPIRLTQVDDRWQFAGESLLTVPPGWQLRFTPELRVLPTMLCNDSEAELLNAGRQTVARLKIQAPSCATREVE
jgi:prepilin-type N-terminal cleavage/methylation domain-containing protein